MNQQTTAQKQQGATLIVVLLLLVVLASIAVVAVKESNTNLKIATATQVDAVLFQANDRAFYQFEQSINQSQNDKSNNQFNHTNLLILFNQMQVGEQTILCPATSTNSNQQGYCDLSNASDYNNLGKVITQLGFVVANRDDKSCQVRLQGYATSVLPAMSNKSSTSSMTGSTGSMFSMQNKISECLTQHYAINPDNAINPGNDRVTHCLREIKAVASTHRQGYQLIKTTSEPDCQGDVIGFRLKPTDWQAY